MDSTRINLALQGGGAHGAFTWGVLDRLLDEPWLDISAVSGTSAGALNGAALKAGLATRPGRGGREAARENLAHVWNEVSRISDSRVVRWLTSFLPMPRGLERLTEAVSPFAWFEQVSRLVSPYDYGVFYSNPLATVLKSLPHGDFAAEAGPVLFVNATNVRTGQARVFSRADVSVDAILASACLPTIYRAVKIFDPATGREETYWDGGYSGNPALWPLYHRDLPRDIVVVNINPMRRDAIPRSPAEIQDRVNEVSFNAAMLSELRSINFVKRLHAEGRLSGREMKVPLMHMILDDALMTDLTARTKILPRPGMIGRMHEAGRAAADAFLTRCAKSLGRRDTVNFDTMFPRPQGQDGGAAALLSGATRPAASAFDV